MGKTLRCADSRKKLLPTRNRKSSLCSFGLDSTTVKNQNPLLQRQRSSSMKIIKFLSIFFCAAASALAQQAPWGRPDIPISSRDRVYTADQTSNTVSVI